MTARPSFVSGLERRNVLRMAGLSRVGAWLVVQVAGVVFPAFDAPARALRGLIIVPAVGARDDAARGGRASRSRRERACV